MGRYLASKNRVSAGIATILVTAIGGMTLTAVVLADAADTSKPTPFHAAPPSPVPLPDGSATLEPRTDVLTYSVMSDRWAQYGQARREILCVAWDGGYVIKNGEAVTLTRDAVVVQEMKRAAKAEPSLIDWLEHGTVAQFLDETCPAFWASHPGEVGTAESIDRAPKGGKR